MNKKDRDAMVEKDVTELFTRVDADDVIRMHGQVWRVRERTLVCIEDLTEPSGSALGPSNWRGSYVGVYGRATFADDMEGSGRSVVQVRSLAYPEADGLRVTCDMLRTSSGTIEEDERGIVLVTRRTRYVFRRVQGEEALKVEACLDVGVSQDAR